MFVGSFEHQVDTKGRMRIPASFRKLFESDNVVAVKGSNHCIYIYEQSMLDKDLQGYLGATFANEDPRAGKVRRLISASAVSIQQDAQSRFTIGAKLKEFAGINKDVVFLGNGNRIELWSKENWDKYVDGADDDYDELLLSLVRKDGGSVQ